jgi:type II secretion system (T2SS) protein G
MRCCYFKDNKTVTYRASEPATPNNRKFPVAFIVVALLIVIPILGLVLFSGEDNKDNDSSEEVSSTSEGKPEQTKMSDIDRIAAFNPGMANNIQRQQVLAKLHSLKTMLYMFGTEGDEPPSNEEGLPALVEKGYLKQGDITDEWGNTFEYRLEWGKEDAFWKEYKIFVHSKGPDGISGNADDIGMP